MTQAHGLGIGTPNKPLSVRNVRNLLDINAGTKYRLPGTFYGHSGVAKYV